MREEGGKERREGINIRRAGEEERRNEGGSEA